MNQPKTLRRVQQSNRSFWEKNQDGVLHHLVPIAAFVLLFAIVGVYFLVKPHAAAPSTTTTTATTTTSDADSAVAVPDGIHNDAIMAGYEAGSTTVLSGATGTFRVPKVDCAKNKSTYGYYWVGIGSDNGYTTTGFEAQTGIGIECTSKGKNEPFAFRELYPSPIYTVPLRFDEGDNVVADVTYEGNNKFRLSLTDYHTGSSWSNEYSAPASEVNRHYAQWFVEAPSNRYPFHHDAQSITFNNDTAYITKGKNRPINYFNVQKPTMSIPGKGTMSAGGLFSGGTAFTDNPS